MRRLDRGPSRRQRRAAHKGQSTGRRATHLVETTYGRHQKEQVRTAAFADMLRQLRDAS